MRSDRESKFKQLQYIEIVPENDEKFKTSDDTY